MGQRPRLCGAETHAATTPGLGCSWFSEGLSAGKKANIIPVILLTRGWRLSEFRKDNDLMNFSNNNLIT